jgi:hypothetical protein
VPDPGAAASLLCTHALSSTQTQHEAFASTPYRCKYYYERPVLVGTTYGRTYLLSFRGGFPMPTYVRTPNGVRIKLAGKLNGRLRKRRWMPEGQPAASHPNQRVPTCTEYYVRGVVVPRRTVLPFHHLQGTTTYVRNRDTLHHQITEIVLARRNPTCSGEQCS